MMAKPRRCRMPCRRPRTALSGSRRGGRAGGRAGCLEAGPVGGVEGLEADGAGPVCRVSGASHRPQVGMRVGGSRHLWAYDDAVTDRDHDTDKADPDPHLLTTRLERRLGRAVLAATCRPRGDTPRSRRRSPGRFACLATRPLVHGVRVASAAAAAVPARPVRRPAGRCRRARRDPRAPGPRRPRRGRRARRRVASGRRGRAGEPRYGRPRTEARRHQRRAAGPLAGGDEEAPRAPTTASGTPRGANLHATGV